MSSLTLDIAVESPAWSAQDTDWDTCLRRVAQTTLIHAGFGEKTVELSLVLADDSFIQNLNKTYRGKDAPTNVLSFPQFEPHELQGLTGEIPLGDIILAYGTLQKEATEQGKSFEHHAVHLTVHGLLHLLGHDHETETEAEMMEQLEIQILRTLGIKNPYAPPA